MYLMRKNYFKDYTWETQGNHNPPNALLDPYDNHTWWFDPRWAKDEVPRWYQSWLLWTTKHYALTHHEYVSGMKSGIFIQTGGVQDPGQAIQFIESANENPATAGTRPGFPGQYGASAAVKFTGTMYEHAFGWGGPSQIAEEPAPTPPLYGPVGPLGFSIYAVSGLGMTTAGIHIAIIPANSFMTLLDSAGAWMTVNGPAIEVCTGTLEPMVLTHVTTFTTFEDTTPLTFNPDKEYFIRMCYWPEQKNLKEFPEVDSYGSNPTKDRRLRIWLGEENGYAAIASDKKRWQYVGESSLIEYSYNVPSQWVYRWAMDYYWDYTLQQGDFIAYEAGVIQFDEAVVGSEWLPYVSGQCHSGIDWDPSWLKWKWKIDSNELTRTITDEDAFIPLWQVGEQVELFARHRVLYPIEDSIYSTHFSNAFADGWTVTNTTGTWQQCDSITPWRDDFTEVYANKDRDPNWDITAGTIDTSTTSGVLTFTHAGGGDAYNYAYATVAGIASDFVCDTTIKANLAFSGLMFGLQAGGVINTTLLVEHEITSATNTDVFLYEYVGGMWNLVGSGSYTSADSTAKVVVRVVRVGALCKVYYGDTLLMTGCLATTACVGTQVGYNTYTSGCVLESEYLYVNPPFPDDYAYMTNTGGVTTILGNIQRNPVVNLVSFSATVDLWEAFQETDAVGENGQIGVQLHYDGGGAGTNHTGIAIIWTHASQEYVLRVYQTSAVYTDFPLDVTNLSVLNGYHQHRYTIWCTVSAGNITAVTVFDADMNYLAGLSGLALAYTAMRIRVRPATTSGCEGPYTGYLAFTEYPAEENDIVEVPVFHGIIVRPVERDTDGTYTCEAQNMAAPLKALRALDTGGDYVSEGVYTDEQVIQQLFSEDGDPYWRWFHIWNFNIANFPGTWLPHRFRGASWWDFMNEFGKYCNMHFQITPEQQCLFWQYYRDMYTADPLEIGSYVPDGIYLSSASMQKSQTNMIDGLIRVDDAHYSVRSNSVTYQPVDFIQDRNPGVGSMVGPANPGNPIPATTRADATRVTDVYASTEDMVMSSVGADNAAAASVAAYLTTMGDNLLTNIAHKNQLLKATLLGSKLYFRPMDKVQVDWAQWDPTLNDTVAQVVPDMYVVQSAEHFLEQNRVSYMLGRIEAGDEQAGVVTGYGSVVTDGNLTRHQTDEVTKVNGDVNL